jgi:hypothetical protein
MSGDVSPLPQYEFMVRVGENVSLHFTFFTDGKSFSQNEVFSNNFHKFTRSFYFLAGAYVDKSRIVQVCEISAICGDVFTT